VSVNFFWFSFFVKVNDDVDDDDDDNDDDDDDKDDGFDKKYHNMY